MHKLTNDIQQFLQENEKANIASLALKATPDPSWDYPWVLTQLQCRQKAQLKLPTWYQQSALIYSSVLSMEQCSSELTAAYKASLVSGERIADITGGMGVDLFFLAQNFQQADYVEQQEVLAEVTGKNFRILAGRTSIALHNTTAEVFLETVPNDSYDWIYLDPARRDEQQNKVVMLEDCQPNLLDLKMSLLEKSKQVMVKTSPMLDIKASIRALEGAVREVVVVSVKNETKELLWLLDRAQNEDTKVTSVELREGTIPQEFSFMLEKETYQSAAIEAPMNYLYEPFSSVLKGGGYKNLSVAFAAPKLHAHSHLYTSKELITNFPGRKFKVKWVETFQKKQLRKVLPKGTAMNLSIRNFPQSVAQLKTAHGWKDGGDLYVFATTLKGEKKVLVGCERVV